MTRSPAARQPLLLLAGVAAAALYVSIVQIAAEMTPGYSHIAQPVSSLYESGAAIGAPVAAAFVVYNALVGMFGLAIVRLAQAWPERGHAGVAAGAGIVLCAVAGAIDDIFPQDPTGTAITTPGTLHIAFAGIASLLTIAAVALGAWWLLGRRELRPLAWYSAAFARRHLGVGSRHRCGNRVRLAVHGAPRTRHYPHVHALDGRRVGGARAGPGSG